MAGYINMNNPGYPQQNGYPNYNQGYMQNIPTMQQSYAPAPMPMQSNVVGYQVDGEMAAKAYMIPAGTMGPIALWDLNENVFYMRSFNSAGMPNPLKKYRFYEEEISTALPPGQSGASIDPDKFATKDDFESLRQEIHQLSSALQSQNQTQSAPVNQNTNQQHYNNQNGNNNGRNNNQGRQS